MAQMKRLLIRCSVILLVLLLMASVVGCGLKEVPNIDASNTIVFQSGSPWLEILFNIFLIFVGLGSLLLGIIIVWATAPDFVKKSNKLKALGGFFFTLLFSLLFVFGGAMALVGGTYWSSYSERITFDKSSMTMETEKKYFLRHETHRIAFADISHIKYQTFIAQGQGGTDMPRGEVILVLGDGIEITLSQGVRKSQHKLAQRISEFTHKKIVEENR